MSIQPPTHGLFLDFLCTVLSEMNIHARVGMHPSKEQRTRRRPLRLVHAFYYETAYMHHQRRIVMPGCCV